MNVMKYVHLNKIYVILHAKWKNPYK